jgi:hypothetical protein
MLHTEFWYPVSTEDRASFIGQLDEPGRFGESGFVLEQSGDGMVGYPIFYAVRLTRQGIMTVEYRSMYLTGPTVILTPGSPLHLGDVVSLSRHWDPAAPARCAMLRVVYRPHAGANGRCPDYGSTTDPCLPECDSGVCVAGAHNEPLAYEGDLDWPDVGVFTD